MVWILWTYAGDDWAPGQLSAERLRGEFGFGRVSSNAALYGVVARPSGHSVSPAMHNAAFRAAGLEAVYVPLEAADADDFLTFADAMDIRGASITLPFKVDLLSRVAADDLSRRAGAVNTLVRNRGVERHEHRHCRRTAPLAGRMALNGVPGGGARAGAPHGRRSRFPRLVRASCCSASKRGAHPMRPVDTGVGHAAMPPEAWKLGRSGERDPGRHGAARQPRRGQTRGSMGGLCDLSTTARRRGFSRPTPAGCETLRRPRHVGGAGREAVRVVDRRASSPGVMARPLNRGCGRSRSMAPSPSQAMKLTTFDEFKELASRGVRAGLQEDHRRPSDPVSAFLKIADIRLCVPPRKRRGRRARRPLFVLGKDRPRGPGARRQDDDRTRDGAKTPSRGSCQRCGS